MASIIYDALAGTDINQLLGEAVQIVANTLSADHVLVLELGAIDSQSCFCSSIGWDPSTSLRLGMQLLDQARQPESTDLEEITSGEGSLQGGIYRPSRAFLHEHGLRAGLFAGVPCGEGSLALFAGDARAGALSWESDACSLHAIVTVLSLAVRRASTELAYTANLQQVVQAKHQWETTLDALPQLVCLIDEHGLVIRANRTLETWQLGEVRSIRGTQVHDMLHPGCTDSSCSLSVQLERLSRQLKDTQFAECTLHDLLPGSELHLSLFRGNGSRYGDGDGAAERGYAFLVIEDISQQKRQERLLVDYNKELEKQLQEQSAQLKAANARLEDEVREHMLDKVILRESEKRYACFVENTLTGIYAIKNNRVVFYNNRFAEIFGYGRDDIYRLDLHELFPSDEQWSVSAQMATNSGMGEENTIKGTTRAGEAIWLRRSLSVVGCLSEPMILGTVVDVTAQKNAEDGLRCSERELSALSEKLLLAQEAERKRIALELHDGIGQSLSAIKFGVENALQGCGKRTSHQNGEYLKNVVDKLRDAINEVRSISMGLRPSMLDDLGLVATIGWFCREFQSLHSTIRIKKRVDIEEGEIPAVLKIVIFRILQEALNNIGKHARASTVSVELVRTGGTLKLRIEDDGRGISSEVLQVAKGLGLGSMKERAKLSSGSLTVDTAHGTGTLVQVVWPLP
ncbi:MAG: PAS domain S-box protein [Pseudomonadota bacterium]|nr:PAS domain S-box protein [Pseudomonadota bacterium]